MTVFFFFFMFRLLKNLESVLKIVKKIYGTTDPYGSKRKTQKTKYLK